MAATITDIITKVRRLTRSPSVNQISDAEIINYANTFLVYDFPEHLRTFNLRDTFTWTCNPYQDTYPTDIVGGALNQLNNFKNLYISVHPPVYIAGYQQFYTQSREQFFGIYPKLQSVAASGFIGDGVTVTFSGVLNTSQSIVPPGLTLSNSVLQFHCLFSSIATGGSSLAMVDVPLIDTTNMQFLPQGNLYPAGAQPTLPANYPTVLDPNNNINYITGAYTVTFQQIGNVAPGANQPITTQYVSTALGIPQALCFYDNTFIIRPVPDQPYDINFEVYRRPFELNEVNFTIPELEEWWQLIAYGAAKKVFEDRMDLDSVALILPEYTKQMNLVNRRTVVQNTNDRTATIYTENTQGSGWGTGAGWGTGGF